MALERSSGLLLHISSLPSYGGIGDLTRPDEGTVGRQKQAAATGHQIRSVLVEIRPGDFLAPADPDLVGAVRTPATASPIYKQVIKTVVPINIGRFDGIIKSERIQG